MCVTFCWLLLAVTNVYAGGSQSSLDWLKVVAYAAHQTDYSGVYVYQYDNRVETSRITHVVEPDSEYERIESLDGPKREIIRHHGQIWCYIDNKMVQVDSQQGRGKFPLLLPEQLIALSKNYQVKDVGLERVAGFNAQVILFQPKDNFRYTYKIWVHTDSGLLLKAAALGEKNQLIEQHAFAQLQIGGNIDRSWIGAADLAGRSAGLPVLPETARESAAINSGWVVDALPAGFKKIREIHRPMRGKHTLVTQIVFFDGLSAISIFVEPADGEGDDPVGLSSFGAMNLSQKILDKQLITVTGEAPPHVVRQVLDSVRYSSK
jgi:sigma-E factor negative regulatory protein RseB